MIEIDIILFTMKVSIDDRVVRIIFDPSQTKWIHTVGKSRAFSTAFDYNLHACFTPYTAKFLLKLPVAGGGKIPISP